MLAYRLKHDLGRKGVVISDRERLVGAVRTKDRGTQMDPDNLGMLGEILEEYDFGLIPRFAHAVGTVRDGGLSFFALLTENGANRLALVKL